MNARFLTFFFLLSISLWAQDKNLLSPQQMRADMDALFEQLEAIHPDLYANCNRATFDQQRSKITDQLSQAMSTKAFALQLSPLVAALKDGHTWLTFPQEERKAYLENGGKLFPFGVRIIGNRIYIRSNYSNDSTIQLSTEILSINGVSSETIIQDLAQHKSAELEHFRSIRLQRDFGRMLWYVYGSAEKFKIAFSVRNGEHSFYRNIDGISKDDLNAKYKQRHKKPSSPYSYYQLEGLPIGVIDFQSMRDKKAFRQFLDTTFAQIQANQIEHLVIDIRKNGGGNSQLANQLFDYITDKPYKMIEQMDIKVSRPMKQSIRKHYIKWYLYPLAYPMALFVNQARPYFYGKNGSTKSFEQGKLTKPKAVKNKFTGNTYLLTSHYTFSSANMLAIAYDCYEMGTVIGEETGGVYVAFGELQSFRLPHSQLKIYCSSKRFVHPCHDGELHGVVPDIAIENSAKTLDRKEDRAMEKVKQLATQADSD